MKKDNLVQLIISGVTREQALQFASYFAEQGEQDMSIWFEENEVEGFVAKCGSNYIVETEKSVTMKVETLK